jgi:hypothetical protein
MAIARFNHAQYSLPDGRVIAAGGWSETIGATNTVEFFDPKSNTWRPGLPTPLAATGTPSGLLPGGRVLLVTPGLGTIVGEPDTAFIYDPVLNLWQHAGFLSTRRHEAAGTVMNDGGFLVLGGTTDCFPECAQASAEVNYPLQRAPGVSAEVEVNLKNGEASASVSATGS